MRQIIDSVADGVFIVDPRGLVSFWNPSMEKISGYPAQEAMGKPCTLITCSGCHGETCPSGVTGCDVMENSRSETVECTLKHKDGHDVTIIKKASVITDDQGHVLGVVEAVTDITELRTATLKMEEVTRQLGEIRSMKHIIGKSHEMQKVFSALKAAAASDATILVQGESGTGKELVARAIHVNSDRRDQPFITVNCSALSESLLESELFGHVKGAYTGAVKDRLGRFEEAAGGTIFLDEIGELSGFIQVKLLRVLQEREIERVGDSTRRKVDIRIITATHRDLLSMVVEGLFREDLYYRLKVFPVNLPPLRSRKDDIPLLVARFIEKMNRKTGKRIQEVSPVAMKILLDYHWPGNVRELENTIEHAFVLCKDPFIGPAELPREIQESGFSPRPGYQAGITGSTGMDNGSRYGIIRSRPQPGLYQPILQSPGKRYFGTIERNTNAPPYQKRPEFPDPSIPASPNRRQPKVNREQLLELLEVCNWNKKEVGRRVGVSHTAIWKYMKRWEIPLKKPGV